MANKCWRKIKGHHHWNNDKKNLGISLTKSIMGSPDSRKIGKTGVMVVSYDKTGFEELKDRRYFDDSKKAMNFAKEFMVKNNC